MATASRSNDPATDRETYDGTVAISIALARPAAVPRTSFMNRNVVMAQKAANSGAVNTHTCRGGAGGRMGMCGRAGPLLPTGRGPPAGPGGDQGQFFRAVCEAGLGRPARLLHVERDVQPLQYVPDRAGREDQALQHGGGERQRHARMQTSAARRRPQWRRRRTGYMVPPITRPSGYQVKLSKKFQVL